MFVMIFERVVTYYLQVRRGMKTVFQSSVGMLTFYFYVGFLNTLLVAKVPWQSPSCILDCPLKIREVVLQEKLR